MEALYSPRRRVVTYGKSIRKPIPHIHTLEGSAQGHVTSGDSEASRKRRRIQNSMPAQPLAKAPRSANRGQQDEVASTLSLRDRAHGESTTQLRMIKQRLMVRSSVFLMFHRPERIKRLNKTGSNNVSMKHQTNA